LFYLPIKLNYRTLVGDSMHSMQNFSFVSKILSNCNKK
jgi:hypothetical protein